MVGLTVGWATKHKKRNAKVDTRPNEPHTQAYLQQTIHY